MKRTILSLLFLILFLHVFPQNRPKPEQPQTRILFIFDASQSMSGPWENTKKIDVARKVLIDIIDSLEYLENVQLALRIYGHQSPVPPQDCSDTRLEVPFSPNNEGVIRQKLRYLNPKGTTPIANSLSYAAQDFVKCEDCRNIVILITDGVEACDGDPCAVSDHLQKKGIVLKPFIIGVGIDENFAKTFNCIGRYYNTNDEKKFREVFNVVISQALNSTTAQVNLLDEQGIPSESNVNMTFYDRYSGKVKHNYMHTINHRGKPDTLILDPLVTYRIVVQTIPPTFIDSAKVVPGKHAIFAVDAPQGYLLVEEKGGSLYRDMKFIVRKSNSTYTLNFQKMGETEKYITGNYDLEIPTLPPLLVNDVEVKQSHTTTVEVPRPAIVTLLMVSPGYGSLYVHEGNNLKWIYNLPTDSKRESLRLQPGKYTVVFRSMNAKQSIYTISRTFEVNSGMSIPVELY